MAGIVTTWDIAVPTGGEDPKNGDDRIRELKLSLEEIFRNGGHRLVAGPSTNASLGRHVCSEEFASGGSGALVGEFYIYDNAGAKVVTVGDATAATASQVTIAAGYLLRALGTFRVTGAVTLDAALSVGTTLGVTGISTFSNTVQPNANNTIDLGVTATNGWRDLWLARNASVGGTMIFVGGSRSAPAVFTGGPQTLTIANRIVSCSFGGGAGYTINLPAVATAVAGTEFFIFINALGAGLANTVTIDPSGAELIDGAATKGLIRNVSGNRYGMHVVSDGTGWQIVNDMVLP